LPYRCHSVHSTAACGSGILSFPVRALALVSRPLRCLSSRTKRCASELHPSDASVEVAYQMTPDPRGHPPGRTCLQRSLHDYEKTLGRSTRQHVWMAHVQGCKPRLRCQRHLAWSTEICLLQITCISNYMLEAWTDIRGAVSISSHKARLLIDVQF